MNKPELTQEIIRELLDYDPETGVMTWKERDGEWFKSDRDCKAWNARWAGREAGSCRATRANYGYARKELVILHTTYLYHRVIWLWMTGEWPKDHIDHINRDATDNRWRNLRLTDACGNNLNKSMYRNNSSGFSGVLWRKDRKRWEAAVRVGGKIHHLGCFVEDDLESAAKAVEDFRREHGFSEDHGKEHAHYYKGDSE